MILEDRAAAVCRVLPAGLTDRLRRWGAAALTPWLFSVRTGYLRSALAGRPVDRHGSPLPWYTYPALEFLRSQALERRRVLEFGAGNSTLWWAGKGAQVVALEDDPAWFRRLQPLLPGSAQLHLVPTHLEGVETLLAGQPFDIIVIDGLDRYAGARLALGLLARHGAVLLDDSEGYWGGDATRTYPIIELFRDAGYRRIDFYGHAPGVVRPHCTSLFFRDDCFLLAGENPPERRAAGR